MAEPRDFIHLSKMRIPCVLGIFPWERRRQQALDVEISLRLELDVAARGDLASTLDYAAVFEQIRFIARYGRWPLVESVAMAMTRHLLSPRAPGESRPEVEVARVRLEKPEALQGRALPSVELERDRAWCELHRKPLGSAPSIESLQQTDDAGAYHVDLPAGAAWHLPETARALVVAGRVESRGRVLRPNDASGPGEQTLVNPDASPARLLVVADPPLTAPGG